jgi:hypothetical protein
MLSKDTRFARYSRAFCWLLAAIWLVLGLFLMTSPRSSEAFTGVLWILGAGFFFATGLYLPRSKSAGVKGGKDETK